MPQELLVLEFAAKPHGIVEHHEPARRVVGLRRGRSQYGEESPPPHGAVWANRLETPIRDLFSFVGPAHP